MVQNRDPLAEDTIAAISTPQGRGAIALVRISGGRALEILRTLAPELNGRLPRPREQRLLRIVHPESGELLDNALVSLFPGPNSFTGEDTVELATHGGVLTPQLVLAGALAAGARPALPGEFTRRALLNGKLDLTQAEATLDLIDAASPAFHRAAIHQLDRSLTRRVEELREALLNAEALVAYGIDFPDEDEPPVPQARIVDAVREVRARGERMLRTAPEGALLRDGAMVVLAGRPNAGKSSLFNALIGRERSIVTEIPGTTRDAVEAEVVLDDYPFRLVDTAGLRDTGDRVEAMGVEVARRYLAGAEIILYCVASGESLAAEDRRFLEEVRSPSILIVGTKADQRAGPSEGEVEISVSSVTGEGLEALKERLVQLSFSNLRSEPPEAPVVTRERHARALRRAVEELDAFLAAVEQQVPAELASTHLAAAGHSLHEIIGTIHPDDVLGAVFSQFCVGK